MLGIWAGWQLVREVGPAGSKDRMADLGAEDRARRVDC